MTRIAIIAWACLTAAAAGAWDEPGHWAETGPVAQWQALDGHFLRIEGLTGSRGAAEYGRDQKAVYEETLRYRGPLPALDVAAFLALPLPEREQRIEMAGSQLRRVAGFRARLTDLVMRAKGQQDAVWGNRQGDPDVVGEMLACLRTATGLDPANPHAWHLLAYFATVAGDVERALDALDALDAALAALPDDALRDVRRRAALDRAWILRDQGYFGQAAGSVDRAEALGAADLESRLLRGLLAAQSGDTNLAFRLAVELDGVELPVFQRDWTTTGLTAGILDPQAWPTKPSGHLRSWILALAWLHDGDAAMAGRAFGEFPRDRHYFQGQRFWSEAGDIYEATGRLELADKAWGLAQIYLPYYPYLLHKPYGLALDSVTGRPGTLPLVLGFDRFFLCGSRLALGAALVNKAAYSTDRPEQESAAAAAVTQLEACLRSGLNTAAAGLLLGQAQAILGQPFEMLRAAEQAAAALDRPDQDQTCRPLVEALAATALARLRAAGEALPPQWLGEALPWDPARDPAEVEAELRARHEREPSNETARRALAWFLIRHDRPLEGADLAALPLTQGREPAVEDLLLLLEVDRLRNDPARARELLADLLAGRAERRRDARLWILVGVICRDHGVPEGRRALEHALALDPQNRGLARHLEMVRQ